MTPAVVSDRTVSNISNGAHTRAPKFYADADFIPTISTDDELDVPDYDAESTDEEFLPAQNESQSKTKRKRSLEDGGKHGKKKQLKVQQNTIVSGASGSSKAARDTTDDEVDEEGEAGVDDGAFDPDFEFQIGGADGGTVLGFEEPWDIPAGSENKNVTRTIGIDEIVKRRREQKEDKLADPARQSEDVENEDDNGFTGFEENDDDEELLAEDAFGMGAEPEDDENDEDDGDTDNDGDKGSEDDSYKDHMRNPSAHLHGGRNSDEEDDDEIAAPVPHPDDISDEDEVDERMKERQAAFFEPDDQNAKTIPVSPGSFQNMSLSRPILKGLSAVGFDSPTPIQVKTIPVALLGKDVVGGAVTGSGKTAAFVIPILERLLYRPKRVPTTRVSILMPTRELAVQCYNVATKLASFTDISFALIVGGLSLREQEQTLRKRPDVVIATPGRFIDHMRNSASFAVENLEILVLDEADRMLEDGFADELNEVLTTIPKSRQTMLFSATMTEDVDQLIRVGLNRPVRLMVDAKKQTVQGLVQEFIKMKAGKQEVNEERRLAYLMHLCEVTYTAKTIVFFPRKSLAHRVKVLFSLQGLKAAELHGSMSQEQRLSAISSFRDGSCTHLLATDLASRGLDIPRVETVINYTVPPTATTYLHRVGRTARAGQTGVSCTLFSAAKKESKAEKKKKDSSVSERTQLRPILRLARNQGADIRTRTIPPATIDDLANKIDSLQEEIDSILEEEKEERLFQQTERDVTKGENLVKYEAEISSRPKRTWFQSEKEKSAASKLGKKQMLGVDVSASAAKGKGKKRLSGKDKKRMQDRDLRTEGKNTGWKKGKSERGSDGNARKSKINKEQQPRKMKRKQK